MPVYNAEPCLDNCLNFITTQTQKNPEAWLVGGGSTDVNPALCDARAVANSRFHVLHQANAGVPATRNAALERATGQYLQSVDGNGYLPSIATERLVRTTGTTGADLVIGHFWRVAGTRKALQDHIRREGVFTRRGFAKEVLKAPANFYYGVLWNELCRRSIVEGGGLRRNSEVNWCEDFLSSLECIRRAWLIAATAQSVYYYAKRLSSLMATQAILTRTVEMRRTAFAAYKQLYQTLDLYDEQRLRAYSYLVSAAKDGGSMALRPPALPKRHTRPPRRQTRRRRIGTA